MSRWTAGLIARLNQHQENLNCFWSMRNSKVIFICRAYDCSLAKVSYSIATMPRGSQLKAMEAQSLRAQSTMNKADLQLKINAEIRKTKLRKLDTMQWALSIPPADYKALLLLKPELDAPDAEIRNLAWKAFIASDLSQPYRVREHKSRVREYV